MEGGNFKTNPYLRIILIKVFTFVIRFIYKKKITDATCGFRAYKTSILTKNFDIIDKKEFYTYGYEYYVLGKILKKLEIALRQIF